MVNDRNNTESLFLYLSQLRLYVNKKIGEAEKEKVPTFILANFFKSYAFEDILDLHHYIGKIDIW